MTGKRKISCRGKATVSSTQHSDAHAKLLQFWSSQASVI
jgi:hypothetical protein